MDEYEVGRTYLRARDGKFYRYTGGDPKNIANWTLSETAVSGPSPRDDARPRNRISLSDAARMALQGLTAHFADELAGTGAAMLPGGQGYSEARDASRARVAQIVEDHPIAGRVAEGVGMLPWMALPVGAGAQGVRAGSALIGTAARGALAGGLEGALFGIGQGEGDLVDRAKSAAPEAGIGAVLGGAAGLVPPVLNSIVRRGAQRGARVAADLRRTSGVTNDLRTAIREASSTVEKARADFYRPLEQRFSEVTDLEIVALLKSDDVRKYVPRTVREKAAPSLQDLQELRSKLRRVDRFGTHEELDELMRNRIPGLRAADVAYRSAVQNETALRLGRQSWNKSAADIEELQSRLSPEALQKFREGQVHEVTRRLRLRHGEATESLRTLMEAGPETRDVLRTMFKDDQSFAAFERVLGRERSSQRVAAAFRRYAAPAVKVGAGAAIAGATAMGSYSLLRSLLGDGAATP